MQHPISITVINNSVGIPQSTDGIMMIFAAAVAVSTTFALNTAYLLTQTSDLEALGYTASVDAANSTALHQQVSEFYNQAGAGTLLWIVGVPTSTAYTTYVASATFSTLVRFTAQADPANRAKMIGFCYPVPAALQSAADFPTDVIPAITAIQTIQQQLFAQGYQFSAILDGYNMNSTTLPTGLGTLNTGAAFAVSLCITGTLGNGVSAVGLALGRFARISIGHGFGEVDDGPVDTSTAYLTNSVIIQAGGTLVVGEVCTVVGGAITYDSVVYQPGSTFTVVIGFTTFTTTAAGYVIMNATSMLGMDPVYVNALGSKQFLFLRTWFEHSGFFWNDGATACASTLQLSSQEYNRVANALSADALYFFINQMGKNLPLDVSTGAVSQVYLNAKQAEFYNTYIAPLKADGGTGDITDGALVLSAPNFNATKTMNFTLTIVPTVILGAVTGTVQFSATL